MKIENCIKESFSVIGKEGSTEAGPGFVQNLWADANSHFAEVAHLAKKDENGNLIGIWGAMTDFSRSFQPWEDGFRKGLYLAGVECPDDAQPPEGWTRWVIPGYEYLRVECDHEGVFPEMIAYLEKHHRDHTPHAGTQSPEQSTSSSPPAAGHHRSIRYQLGTVPC